MKLTDKNQFPNALTIMMRVSMTIVVLGVLVIGAHGQQLKSLSNEYRPGDPIRLTLTFDGAVDLTSAGVSFSLVKLSEESQRLWTTNFNVNELKKLRANEYEVNATVPAYAASGLYRVITAWSNVSDLS
jgi:hypothetical protein